MIKEINTFIRNYEEKVIPLYNESSLAYYYASISGKPEDFAKAGELQLKLSQIYADRDDFAVLKKIKTSADIKDKILKREIDVLYNDFAGNQFDKNLLNSIINLSTKVEEKFSTYRAVFNGKQLTDNEIDEILKTSSDSVELEGVWKAGKVIGAEVASDVKRLVEMRNQAARELGYSNYYEMSLDLSEQNVEEMDILFDELEKLTRDEYLKVKSEIDDFLSEKLGISKDELMPWHYQDRFFQHAPQTAETDLDKYFKDKDIEKITRDYFDSIGLPIDDLLENSDLYEKPGKYQHAYCADMNRSGDVRVVCNIKPNHKWMGTMLHEFGHAVYDKFIDHNLPWQLRSHAHIFTTEAIAMLFGRFASDPQWLRDVIGISEEEKEKISEDCFKSLKTDQLVFSRWVQVIYRFERKMYEEPETDLNAYWWELVEKFQMIKKPSGRDNPDWASKIHVALYPAYYHNYMLGELLASQLYYFITNNIIKTGNTKSSFYGIKEVGEFLRSKFFGFGASLHWSELIQYSTGEPLNPVFYKNQFVRN